MYSDLKKLIKFSFFIFIFFNTLAFSIENKIILKINNSIITTIDIFNEANYLKTLNPSLKNLEKNKMIKVSKDSLIREKIKTIEISKFNINEINKEYLENLLKSIYTNIGFKNKIDFLNYINASGINLELIEEKLSIEAQWNQLIYNKFSRKLKINKEKIKKDIQSIEQKSKSFQLYEIVYNIDQNMNSKKLFEKIKKSILEDGFESAAAIYSVSGTSKTGGNLGWVDENSVNKKILKEILDLKIGQHTNPILIPGGFLILKVKDRKDINKKIDIEKELTLKIRSLQNQQLNQYSNIYFKKIKKDILINEK